MLLSLAVFYLLPVGGFAAFAAVMFHQRVGLLEPIAPHVQAAISGPL